MTSSEKVSVAALISVILRRKINRSIDVKWLVVNDAYAQEIIRLCREQGQDDLIEYANRLEKLMFGKISASASQFAATQSLKAKPTMPEYTEAEDELDELDTKLDPSKYVGGLR